MSNSTTQMLRTMGLSNVPAEVNGEEKEMGHCLGAITQQKGKHLSHSPSLADVLKGCLAPQNNPENTPIK